MVMGWYMEAMVISKASWGRRLRSLSGLEVLF